MLRLCLGLGLRLRLLLDWDLRLRLRLNGKLRLGMLQLRLRLNVRLLLGVLLLQLRLDLGLELGLLLSLSLTQRLSWRRLSRRLCLSPLCLSIVRCSRIILRRIWLHVRSLGLGLGLWDLLRLLGLRLSLGLRLRCAIRGTTPHHDPWVRNGPTLPRLWVPSCRRREWAITGLAIWARVPSIWSRLVGRPTITKILLSLCAPISTWVRRLWLRVRRSLLFIDCKKYQYQ